MRLKFLRRGATSITYLWRTSFFTVLMKMCMVIWPHLRRSGLQSVRFSIDFGSFSLVLSSESVEDRGHVAVEGVLQAEADLLDSEEAPGRDQLLKLRPLRLQSCQKRAGCEHRSPIITLRHLTVPRRPPREYHTNILIDIIIDLNRIGYTMDIF